MDNDGNLDEFDSELRDTPRDEPGSFSRLESEGAFVAAALAAAAVAYGGLLLTSWRQPAAAMAASAVAGRFPVVEPMAGTAPHVITARGVALPDRAVEVRHQSAGVNAATLNAIWRRSDRRSLQQAFARLRSETLAFHRCSIKMTDADRAVARCDGVASPDDSESAGGARLVRWTLDFRRTGSNWMIQRVSTR